MVGYLCIVLLKNYRTVAEIAKSFAKTGINDYIQSFCEATTSGDIIHDEYNETFHQKPYQPIEGY